VNEKRVQRHTAAGVGRQDVKAYETDRWLQLKYSTSCDRYIRITTSSSLYTGSKRSPLAFEEEILYKLDESG
jgi:hypothetical protein